MGKTLNKYIQNDNASKLDENVDNHYGRLSEAGPQNISPETFKALMHDIDTYSSRHNDIDGMSHDMINNIFDKHGISYKYTDDDYLDGINQDESPCQTRDNILRDIESLTGYNTFPYSKDQACLAMEAGAKEALENDGNAKFETAKQLQEAEIKWHKDTGVSIPQKNLSDYAQESDGFKGEAKETSKQLKASTDAYTKNFDKYDKLDTICQQLNQYYDSPYLQLAQIYFSYTKQKMQEQQDNIRAEMSKRMDNAKLPENLPNPERGLSSEKTGFNFDQFSSQNVKDFDYKEFLGGKPRHEKSQESATKTSSHQTDGPSAGANGYESNDNVAKTFVNGKPVFTQNSTSKSEVSNKPKSYGDNIDKFMNNEADSQKQIEAQMGFD